MISKSHRLDAEGHKDLVLKGKRYFTENISLKIAKYKDTSRFSVVVSKKVEKRAVDRNSARRRIYAIIRTHYKSVTDPVVYIFSIKKSIKTLSYEDLSKEIDFLFKKAKI